MINLLDFEQLRCNVTVGSNDAVAAEVIVVGIVAKSAAIIHVGGRLSPFAHALIHPVPDATAYHALALELDVVPIFLQVSDGVAHGVSIFAKEEGTTLQVSLLVEPDHVGQVGVHATVHIRYFIHAFIVDETVVKLLNGLLRSDEVAATTTLVTHAPEDDAGMIAVTKHHTHLSVNILSFPFRVTTQAVIGVTLNIGFVHNVDSIVIIQSVHAWVVRIMTRTNRVEVVTFHQQDVFYHAFHGNGFAVNRVSVVSVSTLEHYPLAVDEHLSVAVFYLSEAILLRVNIASDGNVDGVEIRLLSTPEFRVLHFEAEVSVLLAVLYAAYLQYSRLDGLACGVHKFHINTGISLFAEVLEGNVDAEESTAEVVASTATTSSTHHRSEFHILYMQFLTRFEIDVTMYAAHAEHVLVLDV